MRLVLPAPVRVKPPELPAARERVCRRCGAKYRPSYPMQKTCSRSCGVAEYHERQQKARGRVCLSCGKEFSPYPSASHRSAARYCSWTCYSADRPPAKIAAVCEQCGARFERFRARVGRFGRTFCSIKCAGLFHTGPQSGQWRGGGKLYRGKLWQELRQRVRERDGYRCRRCGKSEAEQGGRQMSVDHLMPFRTAETMEEANDLSNLASLCLVCHAYKTGTVERRFVQRGDMDGLTRFIESIHAPSAIEDRYPGARQREEAHAGTVVRPR